MSFWKTLDSEAQLDELRQASFVRPQLIFKHSVTCGISAQAHANLEEAIADLNEHVELHYLDLLRYRSVSNAIASKFGVPHQSPQAILIRNGEVVYHASHFSINPGKIVRSAA
ncbi:MAG: bacillithiol system redox-active protein YtxJ [Bacteroidia bacterium]|nr:bacillithiol system redox-active protein YtxJ [Bacteroidia bacterium]